MADREYGGTLPSVGPDNRSIRRAQLTGESDRDAERFTRPPHHGNRHTERFAAARNTRPTAHANTVTASNTTDRGVRIRRFAAACILFAEATATDRGQLTR